MFRVIVPVSTRRQSPETTNQPMPHSALLAMLLVATLCAAACIPACFLTLIGRGTRKTEVIAMFTGTVVALFTLYLAFTIE